MYSVNLVLFDARFLMSRTLIAVSQTSIMLQFPTAATGSLMIGMAWSLGSFPREITCGSRIPSPDEPPLVLLFSLGQDTRSRESVREGKKSKTTEAAYYPGPNYLSNGHHYQSHTACAPLEQASF